MTNKPMLSVPRELLPCPFCGSNPTLPDGYGTQYEIECSGCGQATSSIQICDLMTIDERVADMFNDYRYGEEFIERAKLAAIESWNNRVEPAAEQPAPVAVVMPARLDTEDGYSVNAANWYNKALDDVELINSLARSKDDLDAGRTVSSDQMKKNLEEKFKGRKS